MATRNCPNCGAELKAAILGGLCPQCVLQKVMAEPKDRGQTLDVSEGQSVQPSTLDSQLSTPRCVRYFGDYELLEEIARGGMGVVYKARQASLNRPVALKMILAGQLAGEAEVKRFHAEAEAAANLDHPNIVAIYEVGEHAGQHYFSMRLVEGASLATEAHKSEARGQRSAAQLSAKVARAIHHAHQRGILHRDIKPGNILIDTKGEPHVTDFGLVRRIAVDSSLTGSGAVMGTPNYMAPEQATGKTKQLTTAVDIWSLGAVLYFLLTGRPPFEGATPLETLRKVVDEEPVPPSQVLRNRQRQEAPSSQAVIRNPRSAIDKDLVTICLKCLEKDPQRRYASANALADDLERWLRREPITARSITCWERGVKWSKRNPAIATLLAAVVVSVVAGLAGVSYQWRRAEEARREALAAYEQASDTAQVLGFTLAEMAAETDRTRVAMRSPDGRWLLQVSNNAAALVDMNSRPPVVIRLKQEAQIRFAAFSPDSRRFVTALSDGTARIWDVQAGRTVGQALQHKGAINCARFSPDGLRIVTGAADKTVRVWDASTGKTLTSPLVQLDDEVVSVRFSDDGQRIMGVSAKGTTLWWDAKTGKMLRGVTPLAVGVVRG